MSVGYCAHLLDFQQHVVQFLLSVTFLGYPEQLLFLFPLP
jgi:hypothetical protein